MRSVAVVAVALGIMACSGSDPMDVADAGDPGDADLSDGSTDAADEPRAGFGEPCTTAPDCESDLCLPVGDAGVCTAACTDDSCPAGYGCQGVVGVVEPGQADDVCVPENPQLCLACELDDDCTALGADLCLAYPDGKSFCSQDCSVIDCPIGYECQTVEVEGSSHEQCVPLSGACDCDEDSGASTEICTITHDFGVCEGTRSCQGASGWSACVPPSPTDVPDATFTDDDCDGIDGQLAAAIFVATTGTDGADCGLDYQAPCLTVSHAIARAVEEGRDSVYLQAGDYDESGPIVVENGIHLYGGYDADWQRGAHTDVDHRVRLEGGVDVLSGELVTLEAASISMTTRVADLVIVGPSATSPGGQGSYAVHIESSTALVLERVGIEGGAGADGLVGSDGDSAPQVAAPPGAPGAAGAELLTSCDATTRAAGGSAGQNFACAGTSGGGGGDSGTIDTSCGPFSSNYGARPGLSGDDAPSGGGGGGAGGPTCGQGSLGQNGAPGGNGAGGSGGSAGGPLIGSFFQTNSGLAGATGSAGRGGGGGGGAGGCDTGTDSYGGGGGGGGAGGCRATSAGSGGQGGGPSVGIFAKDSVVVVSDCTIERGSGGSGGDGGQGGDGQPGGQRGLGGPATDGDAKPGGAGGDGGRGGHSGGGGGGAGGDSVGVASIDSTVTHDCIISGGSGGDGGNGGVSPGNDGQMGSAGRLLLAL